MLVLLKNRWLGFYSSISGYIVTWLFIYGLALALTASIFFYEIPLPSESYPLTDVEFVVSDAVNPNQLPVDDWATVTLPDNWESRPDKVKNIWYRGHIYLQHKPEKRWGILIPALKMNAAVYLNGALLGDGGKFTDPVARNWMTPLLFSVPVSLLHVGTNTFYIRVKSDPAGSGKLAALQLGPYDGLKQAYNIHYRFRITSIQIITAMQLLTGGLIGLLWLVRRKENYYGYYALAVIIWGVHNFNIFVTDIPLSTRTWDWLTYITIGYYSFLAMIFTHRFLEKSYPVIEKTILTLGITASILLTLLNDAIFYEAVFLAWYPFILAVGLYIFSCIGIQAWKRQSAELQLLTATGGTTLLLATHDLLVMHNFLDWQDGYYIQYSAAALLTLFSFILVRRFAQSLNEVDTLNRNLEARVQKKHHELESNYRQLRKLEHEKVKTVERERLARDIHDGMGGHLVSILAMIESGQTSLQAIGQSLKDSLNDLRLMIDSMEIEEDDLESLLGMFRMRMQPRLNNSQIQLEWRVDDTPPIAGFGPREALHILRILQEAITNTIKHANADRIQLSCYCHENNAQQVIIDISDNGSGFVENSVAGNGLENMKKRTGELKGKLSIHSDGHGTTVSIELPTCETL